MKIIFDPAKREQTLSERGLYFADAAGKCNAKEQARYGKQFTQG
jgi:uncharacterized DUF497 family protein